MRVLVIYCHPSKQSFARAIKEAVIEELAASSHEILDVDLYEENFDPVLNADEWLDYHDIEKNVRSVQKYADQLGSVAGIVLIYPSWWYGMPAMLKGYFDKVWAPGVAFDVLPDGNVTTDRLKNIHRLAVVTTHGAPRSLVRDYVGEPGRKFVSKGVLRLCSPDCKLEWYVQYDMDKASRSDLGNFLLRIRNGIRRW